MKHPFRFSILPYFTMGAGGIGLCLRLWLYSAIDEKSLLPASHPADTLLYILTALTLGVLLLATRKSILAPFRRSFRYTAEMIGNCIGAIGLLLYAFSHKNGILVSITSIAGALALLLSAVFSAQKKLPPYWLFAVITATFMVSAVAQCRIWGAIPQIQHYVFSLLAFLSLTLTAYHRTMLAAKHGNRTHLAFWGQSALFLCCISLNTNPALYFGMICWAAVQLLPCYHLMKES